MSYKSYALNRMDEGALITWTDDDGWTHWAWSSAGTRYVVCARLRDGAVVQAGQSRRLGDRRLAWVFDHHYVDVVELGDVPGPVALLARADSDMVEIPG